MSQILQLVTTEHRKQLNARQIRFLVFVVCLHTLPIVAIFTGARWVDPLACVGFSLLYSFGLGGCLHRYFAHRTFKTSRAFQFIMCLLVGMTFGDPIWFAGKHRIHHKHSDTDRDVHSPKQGFWFCWFGSVADEGYSEAEILKHASDLTCYRELRWMHRYYWVTPLVVAIVTYLVGGFSLLAIGYGGSIIVALHGASAINYFCHKGRNRRYETSDTSTNSFVMAILTFGEGWHNNHHHYPNTARAGFFWWEWDPVYYFLKLLAWLGVVWDVRGVPEKVKYDVQPRSS
jgi:stearoyl-CoA desaturase (delta-9 desaturase)